MHVGLVLNSRCITREGPAYSQFASRVIRSRYPRVSLSMELNTLELYYRPLFAHDVQSLSTRGRWRDHGICIA